MQTSDIERIQQAMQQARFEDAHRLLNKHLARTPLDDEARYLQGVAVQALGHLCEALTHYDFVLKKSPTHAGAHYNKALALMGLRRYAESLEHHDAAACLLPENPWPLINRGNANVALKNFEAALYDYDLALRLEPNLPEALTNKGNALAELGRIDDAVQLHQRALQISPAHVHAWINLCAAYSKGQFPSLALEAVNRALELQPHHAHALTHKGLILLEQDQALEALSVLGRAIEISPVDANAWLALGKAQEALARPLEALDSYDRCIAINSQDVQAIGNKASVLDDLGRFSDSEACYQQALSMDPSSAQIHSNLAALLLRQHRYTDAWNQYDHRLKLSSYQGRSLQTVRPEWKGTAVAQPLLLWGEQGIGDQILYASILPELAALPQKKYVALDKRLLPLFARSMPGFEFVDLATVNDELGFAEQLPLGSLPKLFRPDLASFTRAHHPYLQADANRGVELRGKIAQEGKLVCGVSWSSNRKSIGRHKSMSLEQMLVPLASARLHFVDLQYGDTAAERHALQQTHGIEVQHLDEIDNFHDIDGLAALIQACDVVITTSNSTAHLAGALGKSTLLLLPSGKGQLWYWADINGTIPWYPCILPFRQGEIGDWQHPLQAIKAALETRPWN